MREHTEYREREKEIKRVENEEEEERAFIYIEKKRCDTPSSHACSHTLITVRRGGGRGEVIHSSHKLCIV